MDRVSDERLAFLCEQFDEARDGRYMAYCIPNTEWHHAMLDLRDCRAERDEARQQRETLRKASNNATEMYAYAMAGRSKLSETCVRELRILSASGVNLSSLARLLGVDASTVARAVNGDSWAALGDEAGENDAASGVNTEQAMSGVAPAALPNDADQAQAATPAPSPAEPPRWTSVSWSDLQRLAEIAVLEARDDAARHVATGVMCSYPYVAEAAVERWRNTRKEGA